MVHLLGFGGSALIVTAVAMHSVARLRLLGLAGSVLFIVYGAAIGAWPIVVTNAVTTTVHLCRLRTLRKTQSEPTAATRRPPRLRW